VILEHPAYSTDLAPCDFFLYPTMKNHLKGSNFETVDELEKATIAVLLNLQENEF
jgi:hypothetical protein